MGFVHPLCFFFFSFSFTFPVFSVYFLFSSRAAIANRRRWKVPCWRGRSMFPQCHSSLAANDWLGFAMEETTSKYLPLQISHTRCVNANGNSIALVWEKPRIWRMTKPKTDIFQAQFSCLLIRTLIINIQLISPLKT